MSSRHLRRLENELGGEGGLAGLDYGHDDAPVALGMAAPKKKGKKNKKHNRLVGEDDDGPPASSAFAALQLEDDEDDNHNEEEGNDDQAERAREPQPPKKKKNKNKNGAKAKKGGASEPGSGSGATGPTKGKKKGKAKNKENDDDVLEQFMREVQGGEAEGGANEQAAAGARLSEGAGQSAAREYWPLRADPALVNADAELRNAFGRAAVRALDNEREDRNGLRGMLQTAQAHSRGQSAQAKQLRAQLAAKAHRGRLVKPKPHWPPMAAGIRMVKTVGDDENQWFCFEYSGEYHTAQAQYHQCVGSHDPQSLVALLRYNPYHVDTLLQLAQASRQSEDSDLCIDLIEMALYGLESAFHPDFSWTSGKCRLSFQLDVNRSLFRALFNYTQVIGRKGAHKSAFELCKMLLSLDPCNDPLHILLVYDYYAIRAREYGTLLHLLATFPFRDLSVMPNMLFGSALARFMIERGHGAEGDRALLNDETPTATETLTQALAMFPSFLPLVTEKLNQARQSQWASLLGEQPFNATHSHSDTLDHLISLFVARTHGIWREVQINEWLLQCSREVSCGMKDKESLFHSYHAAACEEFPAGPNMLAHIRASEYAEDSEFCTPNDVHPAMDAPRRHRLPPPGATVLQPGTNPMFLFLQSLMPWTVPPDQGEGEGED